MVKLKFKPRKDIDYLSWIIPDYSVKSTPNISSQLLASPLCGFSHEGVGLHSSPVDNPCTSYSSIVDYFSEPSSSHDSFVVSQFPPVSWTDGVSPQGVTLEASVDCSSSVGPQGVTGNVGPQGVTGGVGPQGVTGNVGPQGVTGETSVYCTGGVGPQGVTGNVGPQGVTGETSVGSHGVSCSPLVGSSSLYFPSVDSSAVSQLSLVGISKMPRFPRSGCSGVSLVPQVGHTPEITQWRSDLHESDLDIDYFAVDISVSSLKYGECFPFGFELNVVSMVNFASIQDPIFCNFKFPNVLTTSPY